MSLVDRGFIRKTLMELDDGPGLNAWAEANDVDLEGMLGKTQALLLASVEKNEGLPDIVAAMFCLGYEVRRAQEDPVRVINELHEAHENPDAVDEATGQGRR